MLYGEIWLSHDPRKNKLWSAKSFCDPVTNNVQWDVVAQLPILDISLRFDKADISLESILESLLYHLHFRGLRAEFAKVAVQLCLTSEPQINR